MESRRGADAPRAIHAYIEIVPTDAVKYDLEKLSDRFLKTFQALASSTHYSHRS
jgi:hypothetical protein